jgi:asparagine synthase (glutamine-hydrolysing)
MQAFADSAAVGYPVGDRTYLDGIRAVLPGHTVVVSPDPSGGPEVRVRQYYRPPDERDDSVSFDAAADRLIEILHDVIESHLAADVEVGLILSGGLDSTVLAMLARDAGRPLRSFSVASGPNHPDAVQAARVTRELGWPHSTTMTSFDDYIGAIPGYVHAQECPAKLGGLSLYMLFQHVGGQVKACLNGEGADELFGGYTEYTDRRPLATAIEGRLRNYTALHRMGIGPSPGALEIIDVVSRQQPMQAYVDRLLAANMRDQLVRLHLELIDKCSMAAGLEMRVPFMDHRLVEFVTSLPTQYRVNLPFGIHKHVLKRAALRAWGGDGPVADSVLRRKIGAPMAATSHRDRIAGICERELPGDFLTRHELGPAFGSKFDLLMHELFCEIFLTGRGSYPAGLTIGDFIAERTGRALPVLA